MEINGGVFEGLSEMFCTKEHGSFPITSEVFIELLNGKEER